MSEVLVPALQVWGLTALLALVFAFSGLGLYPYVLTRRDTESPSFVLGVSYFLGLGGYFFLLRLFFLLLGSARLSCYLALLCLLVLGVLSLRQPHTWRVLGSAWRLLPVILLLYPVFTASTFLLWTEATLDVNAWTGLGTGHSGRYANVGIYMAQHDAIPRLAQNYGQSLLVGTHLLLGVWYPWASLPALVAMALTMVTLLFYGFFRDLLQSPGRGALATFMVMGSNIGLSLSHVMPLTNGSPIMIMAYSDMIASVATVMIFALWLHSWVRTAEDRSYWPLLVPFVLGVIWNWFSPENVVVMLALCGGLLVLSLVWSAALPREKLFSLCAAYTIGVAAGATQGGMLLHPRLISDVELPGIASIHGEQGTGVKLKFGMEFVVNYWHESLNGSKYLDQPPADMAPLDQLVDFRVETHFWEGLRVFFFPLLGMIGLAMLRRRRRVAIPGATPETDGYWELFAALCFAAGFVLLFSLFKHADYGDSKWDFARFMIPGVVLGLVCLVFFVQSIATRLSSAAGRFLVWGGFALVSTYGPIPEIVDTIKLNATVWSAGAPLDQRIKLMFALRDLLPEDPSVSMYLTELKSTKAAKRQAALVGLAKFGPAGADAIGVVSEFLKDEDALSRRLAAQALVRIWGAEARDAFPILTAALRQTEDVPARQDAALHLAEFGPEAREAVDVLTEMLPGARRHEAAYALVRIDRAKASAVMPQLVAALSDKDAKVRLKFVQLLGELGSTARPGVEALGYLLHDGDEAVQYAAALALVRIQGAEAVAALPVLINGISQVDVQERVKYLRPLGVLGPAALEAADTVAYLLKEEDVASRRQAALALVQIKGVEAIEAIPTLIDGLNDPDPEMGRQCVAALGRIGPAAAEAVEALTQKVREAEGIRESVAETVKKIQQKSNNP